MGKDLVVLSACYSGLADQSPLPGDDLFGIQRALLHSGVRAVIAGTWDVYDMTGPMIVDEMAKRLAAGEPVSAALAEAQREFLKQQRAEGSSNPWTHPYFWAVYTLTGDGRVHCAADNTNEAALENVSEEREVAFALDRLAGESRQMESRDERRERIQREREVGQYIQNVIDILAPTSLPRRGAYRYTHSNLPGIGFVLIRTEAIPVLNTWGHHYYWGGPSHYRKIEDGIDGEWLPVRGWGWSNWGNPLPKTTPVDKSQK